MQKVPDTYKMKCAADGKELDLKYCKMCSVICCEKCVKDHKSHHPMPITPKIIHECEKFLLSIDNVKSEYRHIKEKIGNFEKEFASSTLFVIKNALPDAIKALSEYMKPVSNDILSYDTPLKFLKLWYPYASAKKNDSEKMLAEHNEMLKRAVDMLEYRYKNIYPVFANYVKKYDPMSPFDNLPLSYREDGFITLFMQDGVFTKLIKLRPQKGSHQIVKNWIIISEKEKTIFYEINDWKISKESEMEPIERTLNDVWIMPQKSGCIYLLRPFIEGKKGLPFLKIDLAKKLLCGIPAPKFLDYNPTFALIDDHLIYHFYQQKDAVQIFDIYDEKSDWKILYKSFEGDSHQPALNKFDGNNDYYKIDQISPNEILIYGGYTYTSYMEDSGGARYYDDNAYLWNSATKTIKNAKMKCKGEEMRELSNAKAAFGLK